MRTQSQDTHPEVERLQIELLRKRGAAWRFAWARSLSRTVIELARRALRRRGHGLPESEIQRTFLRLNYGEALAHSLAHAQPGEDMLPPDIATTLTPLAEAFEDLGIAYAIGGSVASSIHGMPRSTLDVDLVANLPAEKASTLVELIQDTYYVSEAMVREAIVRHSSFNLLHLGTFLKVDVFVLGTRAYDHEAFRRMVREALDEQDESVRSFFVCSAEDTVLSKLEWYRQGGEVSERQWTDVLGVLKVQREALDPDYLRRWAAELGVSDLLTRAIHDAGA